MVSGVTESCDQGQGEQTTQVNTKCCRQVSSRVSNAKTLLVSSFNATQVKTANLLLVLLMITTANYIHTASFTYPVSHKRITRYLKL